jgi:hypothetical protein
MDKTLQIVNFFVKYGMNPLNESSVNAMYQEALELEITSQDIIAVVGYSIPELDTLEAQAEAKRLAIQEEEDARALAQAKLIASGLTVEEIAALTK